MVRLLVWLCGAVGLAYLAYRFAVWHLVWQLSIVCALFLWVVMGGYLLGRDMRGPKRQPPIPVREKIDLIASAERAAYASKFGEDKAAQIDRDEPGFWRRIATPSRTEK